MGPRRKTHPQGGCGYKTEWPDQWSCESVAITTKQLPRDEQMKDTLEARDFDSEEMLGAGLSEDELLNNPYAYEHFCQGRRQLHFLQFC